MIEKLYKFNNRKTGVSWGYSRHQFPDFVCVGLYSKYGRISLSDPRAKEFRDKYWEVEEITDENEIKENII
jgi:hypothetical protein